jgi:hypothetical protein
MDSKWNGNLCVNGFTLTFASGIPAFTPLNFKLKSNPDPGDHFEEIAYIVGSNFEPLPKLDVIFFSFFVRIRNSV